jgi:hypothetical protein
VRQLDGTALDRILARASVHLSQPALIHEFIGPFIRQIGSLWEKGALKIVHEHVAHASLRTFVGQFLRQQPAMAG